MHNTSTSQRLRTSAPPEANGSSRRQRWAVTAILAAVLLAGSAFHPPVEPAMTVVIDAGHGGRDPGNLGTGRYPTVEKDITLAVSLKTAAYIEERIPGVRVIMTRTGDTYPELPDRVRIANDHQADLLMSIHCDSFSKSSAKGSSSFVMGLGKSEASLRVAQKENAVLFEQGGKEALGFDPDDPDTFIALALKQEIYLERSLQFANLIQTQFRERVGRKDRGVRQADYYLTAYANMPSVLVELGFLTNPDEEDFLRSEKGQDFMASALFRAFRDYADHWFNLESAVQKAPDTENGEKADPDNKEQEAPKPADAPPTPAWFSGIKSDCAGELCFTVQAVSSRKGGPLEVQGHKVPFVTKEKVRGVHKYRVGSTLSYEDACRMRDTLRKNGFADAFVVAFDNGNRIPLEVALEKKRN